MMRPRRIHLRFSATLKPLFKFAGHDGRNRMSPDKLANGAGLKTSDGYGREPRSARPRSNRFPQRGSGATANGAGGSPAQARSHIVV
jgi:hypothetical protein